jgi:hypothetical protein
LRLQVSVAASSRAESTTGQHYVRDPGAFAAASQLMRRRFRIGLSELTCADRCCDGKLFVFEIAGEVESCGVGRRRAIVLAIHGYIMSWRGYVLSPRDTVSALLWQSRCSSDDASPCRDLPEATTKTLCAHHHPVTDEPFLPAHATALSYVAARHHDIAA